MNSNKTLIAQMDAEQLGVADHKLHGGKHFAGLYAGEHVAATEFVIGATFVKLGATTLDIVLGLLIGNLLAVLSWTLITSPIAVQTRMSLYTYLGKIAGKSMNTIYNWVNAFIFTVISAAMITVSALAIRHLFHIPVQEMWYPTNFWFVIVVLAVGVVVVFVALYGFNMVADFSGLCAPWLITLFIAGALVMLPEVSNFVLHTPVIASWHDFLHIGDAAIWTGKTPTGEKGIGLIEVIGYAWAANTITHFGLIDMAILRYAKKVSYGLYTSFGMLFGHYIAWIGAGIMGAAAAIIMQTSITAIDPGDVALQALGLSGYIIVVVAGWTTANANLYRAGLAAQGVFPKQSRRRVTLVVGLITAVVACFPFVFNSILPLLVYAGLLVVPVGGIVFAEHFLFPKIGLTRYWAHYKKLTLSKPAVITWGVSLLFGVILLLLQIISFYYLFIPVWAFSILLYTVLASKAGAREHYPKEEAQDKQFSEDVKSYQAELALTEVIAIKDTSFQTRLLNLVSYLCLLVILVLAFHCFLGSPDMPLYRINREVFYTWTFILTISYFILAYWAMTRQKAWSKKIFEAKQVQRRAQ